MEKIFVLDTNVLLHDPMALYAFKEHKIVIPMTVLEELDTIKDRKDKDVSREARIAINAIDGVLSDASPKAIQDGVDIVEAKGGDVTGCLAIFPDQLISHDNEAPYLDGSPQQANIFICIVSLQMQGHINNTVVVGQGLGFRKR